MTHNIRLLRRLHKQVRRFHWQFDQTVQRFRDRDGVRMDLNGWAIELDRQWRFIGDETARLNGQPFGCAQVQHRITEEIRFIDQVGPELMGISSDEATYLLGTSHWQVCAWLEDVLAAHDTKVLDVLDKELDFAHLYFDDADDDYPFGQVRG